MINDVLLENILNRLESLSPNDFQELITRHLISLYGPSNVIAGPSGSDGKVDIIANLTSPTEAPIKAVFQCKRLSTKRINAQVVHETVGAMVIADAEEAVLVSTTSLTKDGRNAIEDWEKKDRKKISWKPWCEKNLSRRLVEKTPSVLIEYFPDLRTILPYANEYEYLFPAFEQIMPPTYKKSSVADHFYNGHLATWEDITAGFDIERNIYTKLDGIKKKVSDLLKQNDGIPRVIALLGVAGTGKTTLLRRAAIDFAEEGYLVLRIKEDWKNISFVNLVKHVDDIVKLGRNGVLIIIDDDSNIIFEKNIFNSIINKSIVTCPLVIVIADQPDRWNFAKRNLNSLVEGENFFWFGINHLLPKECENLVDRIIEYEEKGILSQIYCSLSRKERLDLCQEVSDRQLVVAMLQMRHGKRFRNIIEKEYENIPKDESKEIYLTICYFNIMGINLPRGLVYKVFKLKTPIAIQEFRDSTQDLFSENLLHFRPRHNLIAKIVAQYVLRSSESRQAALLNVLCSLDLDEENEEEIFLKFFSGQNMHRRIVNQFERNEELIRTFYNELSKVYASSKLYYLKYLMTSQALAERILKNNKKAKELLEKAIEIDPRYVFAHRQLAWVEFNERNWNEAAERAEYTVELDPNNFLSAYQCGIILSFNTVKNFRKAKKYFDLALKILPNDQLILKRLKEYEDARTVMEYVKNLDIDDIIPDYVLSELRPGLSILRSLYGPSSKITKRRLKIDLKRMQEDSGGEVADLYDKIEDIEIKNKSLDALFTCNLARLLYLEWYHKSEDHDLEHIEKLFLHSLKLDNQNPFTHCWYGTFLKEAHKDFISAKKEYELALELGNKSKNPYLESHPLFLNNIALLIMNEVQTQKRPPSSLLEAKKILELAVKRVNEMNSDFFWPINSLSYCLDLIKDLEN